MNTKQFYQQAVSIAKGFGLTGPNIRVTTVSGHYGDENPKHSIGLWTGKKTIESGFHASPGAALEAFCDKLSAYTKQYSQAIEEADIGD